MTTERNAGPTAASGEADDRPGAASALSAGDGECRVRIDGPGLRVDRHVALSRLPDLLALLLADADAARDARADTLRDAVPAAAKRFRTSAPIARAPAAEPAPDAAPEADDPGIGSYLRAKRPPTNPERIAVVGRYLELSEARTTFDRRALRRKLSAAGVPFPRNFARDVQTALARGYLVALADGERLQVAAAARALIDRDGPVWLPRGGKREAVYGPAD